MDCVDLEEHFTIFHYISLHFTIQCKVVGADGVEFGQGLKTLIKRACQNK